MQMQGLFVLIICLSASVTSGWIASPKFMQNRSMKPASSCRYSQVNVFQLQCTSESSSENNVANEDGPDLDSDVEEAEDSESKTNDVEEVVLEADEGESNNATTNDDPARATEKKLKQDLQAELTKAESVLRNERIQLSRTKDRISESGKNGFFLVKAQVNDFLRTKDAEQKELVAQKRRDVVLKLLPILDKLRSTPKEIPAETKRETNMHESFNALLRSILIVIERNGYQETEAAPGEAMDHSKYEIVGEEESEEDGILSTVRKGMLDNRGIVLRKAQVIVGKKAKATATEETETNQAE